MRFNRQTRGRPHRPRNPNHVLQSHGELRNGTIPQGTEAMPASLRGAPHRKEHQRKVSSSWWWSHRETKLPMQVVCTTEERILSSTQTQEEIRLRRLVADGSGLLIRRGKPPRWFESSRGHEVAGPLQTSTGPAGKRADPEPVEPVEAGHSGSQRVASRCCLRVPACQGSRVGTPHA